MGLSLCLFNFNVCPSNSGELILSVYILLYVHSFGPVSCSVLGEICVMNLEGL